MFINLAIIITESDLRTIYNNKAIPLTSGEMHTELRVDLHVVQQCSVNEVSFFFNQTLHITGEEVGNDDKLMGIVSQDISHSVNPLWF